MSFLWCFTRFSSVVLWCNLCQKVAKKPFEKPYFDTGNETSFDTGNDFQNAINSARNSALSGTKIALFQNPFCMSKYVTKHPFSFRTLLLLLLVCPFHGLGVHVLFLADVLPTFKVHYHRCHITLVVTQQQVAHLVAITSEVGLFRHRIPLIILEIHHIASCFVSSKGRCFLFYW